MYVECPLKPTDRKKPWIFLAGGITNCENWQQEVKEKILINDCYLLNPRRENFPINDPSASEFQIKWEFEMLNQSDLITFWFSDQSIQPIVLYELGRYLGLSKKIILSVNPNYERKIDVYWQSKLANKCLEINNSLEEHINKINDWIKNYWWVNQ